ncbi:MAG: AtpZ/AtpI family protein [Dehalococcoidales bacterium]|nr:MAG: AtpZ/AtpI family protein [Dehalococcoidales bacterium]
MKSWVPALGLIGVGFFIAGCIIGGILGGQWLDEKLDTEPAFLITGLVLGMVIVFFGVYNMIKPIMDDIRKGGKYS